MILARLLICSAVLLGILELARGVAAAPGGLERSFSGDGRVVTDVQDGSKDFPTAADFDASGRLVVVGSSIRPPLGTRLTVARYLPDGSLDPGFGAGGLVVSDAEGGMTPSDVEIDDAARIVAAGGDARGRPIVVRLLPDGRFDPGLGGDGVVRYDAEIDVAALTHDGAGRIVLAGSRRVGGDSDLAIGRLLPDGRPDRGLGGTGAVVVDLAPGAPDAGRDVLVERPSGRIVVAGGAWLPRPGASRNVGHFALARLREDGTLDRSLRGEGAALIRMNRRGAYANALVAHGPGNVVLAGNAAPRAGFVRVRDAGGLDKRFGDGGRAKLAVRGGIEPVALDNSRGGRILAALGASRTFNAGGGRLIGARLFGSGEPDRGLGGDSRVATGFGRWSATAATVAGFGFAGFALAGPAKRAAADHHDFAIARYQR